jgi:hypothetical protein
MMAVSHPTVVSVNLCSKKGVQLGLLLLQLELGFLCMVLGWLESQHCKVIRLSVLKAFAFGQINRQGGGFDAWHASGLAGRIAGGFDEGRAGGLAGRFIGGQPLNW